MNLTLLWKKFANTIDFSKTHRKHSEKLIDLLPFCTMQKYYYRAIRFIWPPAPSFHIH